MACFFQKIDSNHKLYLQQNILLYCMLALSFCHINGILSEQRDALYHFFNEMGRQ